MVDQLKKTARFVCGRLQQTLAPMHCRSVPQSWTAVMELLCGRNAAKILEANKKCPTFFVLVNMMKSSLFALSSLYSVADMP